jgi:hypothetical protein
MRRPVDRSAMQLSITDIHPAASIPIKSSGRIQAGRFTLEQFDRTGPVDLGNGLKRTGDIRE